MFDIGKRKKFLGIILQVVVLVMLIFSDYFINMAVDYIKGKMNPVIMNFTVNSATVISNDHVGDDWGFSVKADGIHLKNLSSEIEVWEGKKLKIVFTATEYDEGEDDVGTYVFEKRLTEYDLLNGIEISGNIIVRENSGRYERNKAKIYVKAELNPIVENELSSDEWMYEYEYEWSEAMYDVTERTPEARQKRKEKLDNSEYKLALEWSDREQNRGQSKKQIMEAMEAEKQYALSKIKKNRD